jgi:hypothetical protein
MTWRWQAVAARMTALGLTLALGACSPVMTTRYRDAPLSELKQPDGELCRFELASGATVDMYVTGNAAGRLTGQDARGKRVAVDSRDVRRVGIAFEERDAPASVIKTMVGMSAGYAGFLLGMLVLVAAGR